MNKITSAWQVTIDVGMTDQSARFEKLMLELTSVIIEWANRHLSEPLIAASCDPNKGLIYLICGSRWDADALLRRANSVEQKVGRDD